MSTINGYPKREYHKQKRRVQAEVKCLNEYFDAGGIRASVTWFPNGDFYVGFLYTADRPNYPEILTPDTPDLKQAVELVLYELGKRYRTVL